MGLNSGPIGSYIGTVTPMLPGIRSHIPGHNSSPKNDNIDCFSAAKPYNSDSGRTVCVLLHTKPKSLIENAQMASVLNPFLVLVFRPQNEALGRYFDHDRDDMGVK